MSEPFSTQQLAKALEQHASGLKLSFYGLVLMAGGLLGVLTLFVGPLLKVERNAFAWSIGLGATLAIVGGFVNMWGKYRCFEFPIPLSGRWLLSVAIWCDGIMLATRFVSRLVPIFKVFRLAEPILFLTGLVFFLLFLRSLADVIHRSDLRRSAIHVLVGMALSVLTIPLFIVGVAIRAKGKDPTLLLVFSSISLLCIVATMGLYARLLWQMSLGLADFAKYLQTAEEHLTGSDEEEMLSEEGS